MQLHSEKRHNDQKETILRIPTSACFMAFLPVILSHSLKNVKSEKSVPLFLRKDTHGALRILFCSNNEEYNIGENDQKSTTRQRQGNVAHSRNGVRCWSIQDPCASAKGI